MALSLNFAMSFMPERKYLAKLLELFNRYQSREMFLLNVKDSSGDRTLFQLISDATGIPTGASSGKVAPHIDYLRGMGLIELDGDWFKLTAFGKVLFFEDRFFDERISQLACHAMICDCETGAILYSNIVDYVSRTGEVDKVRVQNALRVSSRAMAAFVGMYTTDSSFAKVRVLSFARDELISFEEAPITDEYVPLYGAIVAHLFYQYFRNDGQVSVHQFEDVTRFGARFGFPPERLDAVFDLLSASGYVQLSSLIKPPVFSMVMDEQAAWSKLYDNLI